MPTILALGLAAAVYPQLLAVVVIILTRPNPQRLLWACYLGAASVTLSCGAAILALFRARDTVAGSTARGIGGATYLIVGTIALLVAALVATRRGRELLGRARSRVRLRPGNRQARTSRREKPRTERLLGRGSIAVAAGVGAILGVPGPFDFLALGRLARGAYGTLVLVVAFLAFTVLKLLLIELPLLSYTLHPEATAARVDRFAAWMNAYKLDLIAGVVGVVGAVLVGRGISRLI